MSDFRFEITANPEPDDPMSTHLVEIFDVETGKLLERHITGDPYGMVEAAREVQEAQDAGVPAIEYWADRDLEAGF